MLDEKNEVLPAERVSLWLAGRRYTPDAAPTSGSAAAAVPEIVVPYGSSRGAVKAVLTLTDAPAPNAAAAAAASAANTWSFSSLFPFERTPEAYNLSASFYVERESLIQKTNTEATLLVKAQLMLNVSYAASFPGGFFIAMFYCSKIQR